MSSRFFGLLNSMIFDLKRSVDLGRLFDPVLHSSLDDLVFNSRDLRIGYFVFKGQNPPTVIVMKRNTEIICHLFNT